MNIDEDFKVMTGYDDCIIGVGIRFGQEPIVMYSYEKVIEKLIADGLDYEEAEEWFDFNMIGAWVGERTPGFLITDYTME
jgi:hypothetical protein